MLSESRTGLLIRKEQSIWPPTIELSAGASGDVESAQDWRIEGSALIRFLDGIYNHPADHWWSCILAGEMLTIACYRGQLTMSRMKWAHELYKVLGHKHRMLYLAGCQLSFGW